jgi:hypothetical protein
MRDPASGQIVLACGQEDPLISQFEPLGCLGFVEPVRAVPPSPPRSRNTFGLIGLTQAIDRQARRHRCAAGALAEGDVVGELGALLASPPEGGIPIWIVDGRAMTAMHRPPASRPSPTAAARWTLAPLRWRGFSRKGARLRAVPSRGAVAALRLARRPRMPLEPDGDPAGWLKGDGSEGLPGLWCAYHPVTGDQRLSRTWEELVDMGYRELELLGFLLPERPLTGDLETPVAEVPWASRFGLTARRG